MKIMMGVDLEGITGVVSREHTAVAGRLYGRAVELMVGDINAAVAGLIGAGADEIIVWDNHAGSFNAPFAKLHPGAKYLRGSGPNRLRWPFLDEGVDGLILLGYHAKAGTAHAVLEHTMSSASWLRLTVNGRQIGEIGIDGALAGAVGVPVIMVSGDDKLCAEGSELFGPELVSVCVKHARSRHGALCLSPQRSADLIRSGAVEAVKRIDKVPPLDLGSPAVVELAFKHTDHADAADLRAFEGRRVDGYTVQWTCPDFATWMGSTERLLPPFGPE
jgi:D-amino peptidase